MKTASMRRILFWVWAGLSLLGLSQETAQAAADSAGTEFYVAFQRNAGTGNLTLFITGQQDTQGLAQVPGLNFSQVFQVQANKITTVTIPSATQFLPNNVISKFGVRVTADKEVTVYGLNQVTFTTDAFLALPTDTLGLEYMAMSYHAVYPSQIAAVGAFDNTQVTIVPSVAANGRAAGVPFTITLNRSETFSLSSSGDLTGTSVTATAPVALMSGVECANVPIGTYYCDHIVEMMPPVATYGKSFLTVPLATRLKGDVFRILAAQDGTAIRINGAVVATLNRGKFFETVLTTRSEIEASAPVLVAQYSPGQTFDGVISDPFMMLVPPTEQFLDRYTFSTPATGFSKHFVNVVAPTSAITSLALDGAPLDTALFSSIGSSGFSGAQVAITPGSHNISGSLPFGIYVYGFGSYDSYGYPGGMAFRFINPIGDTYVPNIKLIQIGDSIQGTATDSEDVNVNGGLDPGEDLNGNGVIDRRSEDVNNNGTLDPGEDLNGNGFLDRDTGVFRVELEPGSTNLQITVAPFIPGTLAVNFSITLLDPKAMGSGVLRVSDGVGNVVQSPISLSGLPTLRNVRVVSTLSTVDIDLDSASFAKPPYSITPAGDKTLIEWRFDTFPVNLTEDLGYEVVMKNPVGGEQRVVTQRLELFYTDVNGKSVRTELGPQFVNVLPSAYQLGVKTDKASYTANETVLISTTVTNLSAFAGNATARLFIKDGKGVLVKDLGTLPTQSLVAGEIRVLTGLDFATGTTYVGSYQVQAELIDGSGNPFAVAVAPFYIVSGTGAGVSASITTDRQAYLPLSTVTISDRIINTSKNASLDDLTAFTVVYKPDGNVFWSGSSAVGQLVPGALKDLNYRVSLGNAAPGSYRLTLVVRDSQGQERATAETTISVQSTGATGFGLKGSLTATPKPVLQTETITLAAQVGNLGNSDINNLPLSLLILDPASLQTVIEWTGINTSLASQGSYLFSRVWDVTGEVGTTYVALLRAYVDGQYKVLATDSFVVAKKIDSELRLGPKGRLLVLLDGVKAKDDDNDHDDSDHHHDEPQGIKDPHGPTGAPDLPVQKAYLESLLKQAGWSYTIVETAQGFTHELRTGGYAAYALLAEHVKLSESVQKELRESVFRGEGLFMAGTHDARNHELFDVMGVKPIGRVSHAVSVVFGTNPFNITGEETLIPDDKALRIKRTTAQGAATYRVAGASVGDDDLDCASHDTRVTSSSEVSDDSDVNCKQYLDAITYNDYGRGKAVFAGFDLLATAADKPSGLFGATLLAALDYVHPRTLPLVAGSVVPVELRLRNLGIPASLQAYVVLPTGVKVVDLNGAALNPDGVQWELSMGMNEERILQFWVSLPDAPGPVTFTGQIEIKVGGINVTVGKPYLSLDVQQAVSVSEVVAILDVLLSAGQLNRDDRKEVEEARESLLRAQQYFAVEPDKALKEALKAADALSKIVAAEFVPVRALLAEWIRLIELKLQ